MLSTPLSYVFLINDREYMRSQKPFQIGDILLDREYNTACKCAEINFFEHTVTVEDDRGIILDYDLPMERFYRLIPFHPKNN